MARPVRVDLVGSDRDAPAGAKEGPLILVPRAVPLVGPVIEITPTPEEYDQLVGDLARLRERGAPSNTAAVVEAVHAVAGGRINDADHAVGRP